MGHVIDDVAGVSWQQEGHLRREYERGRRGGLVSTLFRVPDDLSTAELDRRAADLVAREEALRVVGVSGPPWRAAYSSDVEPPIEHVSVSSLDELRALTAKLTDTAFSRVDSPLWSMSVIEHPDEAGRRARSVCAVFDHLVSDDRSRSLVQDALVGASPQPADDARPRYRDWVDEQWRRYPADAAIPTPARDFWLRHLDGRSPEQPVSLPFCPDPLGQLSGVDQILYRELPVSPATLRSAARQRRASPFLVFVGAIASAVGRVGDATEVTFKVNTLGREREYHDVVGMFADMAPLRVRHPSLADPSAAMQAATDAWLDVLGHLTTPWDYVVMLGCGGTLPPATYRPAQILVNFIPWVLDLPWSFQLEPRVEPGSISALQLIFFVTGDGRCRLRCEFDPQRFLPAGVDDFLDTLMRQLVALTA